MKTVRNITLAIAASAGLVVAAAAFAADTPAQGGCQGDRHAARAEHQGHGMQYPGEGMRQHSGEGMRQHSGKGMRHMHGRAKGAEKQREQGGEHDHS